MAQKLPIVTEQKFMKNKKINYNNYAILILFSKFQDIHENTEEGFEGCYDSDRYIYEDRGIIKNKEEIEEMSNTKIETFIKTSRNIAKITNGEMVGVRRLKKSGKVVYDLYTSTHKFVTIEDDILRVMCNSLSSNSIKIYCFLKWKLREEDKIITRKEIAENIGLSSKSHKNLQMISDCTKVLEELHLIKKDRIKLPSVDGNEYDYRTRYELVDYEDWRKIWYSKK